MMDEVSSLVITTALGVALGLSKAHPHRRKRALLDHEQLAKSLHFFGRHGACLKTVKS
jgi:hypothetical protein